MVENARLVPVLNVRPTVASGVSQLQADHRISIRSHYGAVLVEQNLTELREIALRVIGNDELIRVGAAFVRNGNRFPAPDQTSTGAAKTLPAAPCEFGRPAVGRAIPTFHGLDGNPTSDFEMTPLQRLTKWGLNSDDDFAIARNCDPEREKVVVKAIGIFQAC